mmetsp:Transcript_56441/g.168903  ORF Transcript_56441/g.168903 Transcript_56441/m.168903 type:complete len:216 (-) Transcript_56441:452-1099(-)
MIMRRGLSASVADNASTVFCIEETYPLGRFCIAQHAIIWLYKTRVDPVNSRVPIARRVQMLYASPEVAKQTPSHCNIVPRISVVLRYRHRELDIYYGMMPSRGYVYYFPGHLNTTNWAKILRKFLHGFSVSRPDVSKPPRCSAGPIGRRLFAKGGIGPSRSVDHFCEHRTRRIDPLLGRIRREKHPSLCSKKQGIPSRCTEWINMKLGSGTSPSQ